ncbi:pyridoxal phosphate-dependent aminotransferase [Micromonospora sp. NPDC050417]|uniref:pyridoxal phosphate-dependent aminotransferase n=1 Tax=Micromonospora sp. NPDC050417 TaxID=3364280 RepID=UPI00378E354C
MSAPADAGEFVGARRLRQLPVGGLGRFTESVRADTIDLALGTPSWPRPPQAMIDEVTTALRDGHSQYADVRGNPRLRAALAASFATPADPETEVTVTLGASEALCVAALTLLNPGDEVVVLEPAFENFLSAIALASATPRFVRLRPPHWRWEEGALQAAIGPRTRAIIVNSPNNPTGRVLDANEWREIAELAERYDLHVISDEVYTAYVYDGRRHLSVVDVPGLHERGIVVGSLSKTYAVSGWRLGFLRAAPALTRALRQVHLGLTSGVVAPLQEAVARSGVIGSDAWDPRPQLQELRDRAVDIFRGLGLRCHVPEGGCYVVAELDGPYQGQDCADFVYRLAAETGVLVAPGRIFSSDRGANSGFIRVAFNKPPQLLDQAAQRLAPGVSR